MTTDTITKTILGLVTTVALGGNAFQGYGGLGHADEIEVWERRIAEARSDLKTSRDTALAFLSDLREDCEKAAERSDRQCQDLLRLACDR